MEDKRIIFFAPHDNLMANGVLHSQFLQMASFLQSIGARCRVLGLCGGEHRPDEVARFVFDVFQLESWIYPFDIVSGRPIANRMLPYLLLDRFQEAIHSFRPTDIYTRAPRALLAAHKKFKGYEVKTVYDARGAIAAEYLFTQGKKNLAYYDMKVLEKWALHKADRISCVTGGLAEYVYSISGRKTDAIVPCCVTQNAQSAMSGHDRSRLGFDETQKVFCYAGGTSKWQRVEDVVALCAAISSIAADARFLFLSNDREYFEKVACEKGIDKSLYRTVSCPQNEVHDYLRLCHAGIILRHDNTVNRCASPIKVGEYIAAHLPVILSLGIGDYSTELPANGIGVCLDDRFGNLQDVIDFVYRSKLDEMRQKCVNYLRVKLSWNSYIEEFRNIYRN